MQHPDSGGEQAFEGATGPAYDSLVFAGALVLWHLGRADSQRHAADRVRAALDSGEAARRVR